MQALERLTQFRQQLYQTFTRRTTALGEVIDAVAQVARPHSPAELSLVMQRHWSTLYDALDAGTIALEALRPLLAQMAETISPYRVAGCRVVIVDHSGFPRPAARTVAERERYPGPNGTRQCGHRYSFLSQLVDAAGTWLAPLDVDRIGPGSTPVGTALVHLARLAQTSAEPLIGVGDREYGVNDVLRVVPRLPGVPTRFVARLRTNLVFYQPPPPRQPGQKGAPRKYGLRIQLNDPTTWPAPQWSGTSTTARGEPVELRGWRGWRRRGIPEQPVQIVQVVVRRADGPPKYAQPLWLMVVGDALPWETIWPLYQRRWPEETLHRQAKDLLGWSRAQLGTVERQDRWTWLVLLAYWQLLLARDLAHDAPRPWERAAAAGPLPLARVQRDYGRILWQFGLALPPPKPRGKAPGRPRGTRLPPKPRQPILNRRLAAA
jgi:hypothetical protein